MADKETLYQFEPFLSYDLDGSLLMGLPICTHARTGSSNNEVLSEPRVSNYQHGIWGTPLFSENLVAGIVGCLNKAYYPFFIKNDYERHGKGC